MELFRSFWKVNSDFNHHLTFSFCFKIKGVQEIVNPSDLDVLQNAISEKQLVEKAEMPFLTFIEVGFHGRLKFRQPSKAIIFLGQYGKQPICLRDARGERSAEGRGQTNDYI